MNMTIEDLTQYTRQNTGSAFGDSGKFLGYVYQRDTPTSLTYFRGDTPFISLTHWLFHLDHCTSEQELLNESFGKGIDIIDFIKSQKWDFQRVNNTYNHDNDLDQDFQYFTATHDDMTYFIVRVHTGADIRGGYSDPLIFRVPDEDLEEHQVLPKKQLSLRANDSVTHEYMEEWGKDEFNTCNYANPFRELEDWFETQLKEPTFNRLGDIIIINEKKNDLTFVFKLFIDCSVFY